MKIILCILSFIIVCLHALAAAAHLRGKERSANDILMLAGALLSLGGIVLCLTGKNADWLVSLAGYALILYAAIQNGRQKNTFHIRHHIIRAAIFTLLTIGFCFLP